MVFLYSCRNINQIQSISIQSIVQNEAVDTRYNIPRVNKLNKLRPMVQVLNSNTLTHHIRHRVLVCVSLPSSLFEYTNISTPSEPSVSQSLVPLNWMEFDENIKKDILEASVQKLEKHCHNLISMNIRSIYRNIKSHIVFYQQTNTSGIPLTPWLYLAHRQQQ